MEASCGLTCVGNTFVSGRNAGDKGTFSPPFGIVYEGLETA